MKTQTYLRFSLLAPYLIWVFFAGITFIMNKLDSRFLENSALSFLGSAVFIYAFGIILWGIPYTILAVSLWLWSRKKEGRKIARVFAFSPIFLAFLIAIEISIMTYGSAIFSGESTSVSVDMWTSVAALGLFSVVYGYLFIGITAGIYGVLKKSNLLTDEEDASFSPITAVT